MEFPNKTGSYKVDDVDIYVFPDKIVVDTGNRSRRQRDDDYERSGSGKKNKGSDNNSDGNGKKKSDWLNDLLDNAQDIVTGKKQV
ncbi:MAG: hypothetical protein M0Q91_18505 [Methanoregula sp.]|jgi:hypothetical protein|nr:hypothetical protein [Methanoregula sp.]